MNAELERSIAQAAFCWIEYGYYGSESQAITAFRRRRGMRQLTRAFVREHLLAAVAVLQRVIEARDSVSQKYGVRSFWYLESEQYQDAREFLYATLTKEFQSLPETVSYMVAMAWDMSYVR